jgi:hypothetical protein
MKNTVIIALTIMLLTSPAVASDNSDWTSCAVESGVTQDTSQDWRKVPAWARPIIQSQFDGEYRLVSLHGLCNAKTHKIVMCGPGMDETWPSYPVCDAYNERRMEALSSIPACMSAGMKSHDPCVAEGATGLHLASSSKDYSLNCGPYDCEAMAKFYLRTKRVPNPIERGE